MMILLLVLLHLVGGGHGQCLVHEKAEGSHHTYYNISDLGKAVLDKAGEDEINNLVESGCDVNYNGSSLDFSDYEYDYEGFDDWMEDYGDYFSSRFGNYYDYGYDNYGNYYGGKDYDEKYDGEYDDELMGNYNYIYDWDDWEYDYDDYYDYGFDYDIMGGLTALHISVMESDRSMVSKLVAVPGINLEVETTWGGTPLIEAASWGLTKIMKTLLSSGADPNHADPYSGMTPLHITSFFGPLQAVEMLDMYGADLDAVTNFGETALHLAAIYGYPRIVEYLLDRGVDTTVKDKMFGYTALDWAKEFQDMEMVNILQSGSP